jgi:ATP-dependent exoDNAse (exonuclease V) alpha subunit
VHRSRGRIPPGAGRVQRRHPQIGAGSFKTDGSTPICGLLDDRILRVGDKITQIRNNYDKGVNGVFNGTQCVVTSIDLVDQTLTVRTDEGEDIEAYSGAPVVDSCRRGE